MTDFAIVIMIVLVFSVIKSRINAIKISKRPIIVRTSILKSANSTQFYQGRSNPLFFSKVLHINSGENATLNYDDWLNLKSSALFTNLTLEAVSDANGDVQFVVSGIEKPARTFSPETSISLSKFGEPSVTGGVMFADSHFRGLGETIQLYLTQPLEASGPDIRLSWSDNSIGKSSRINLGYSRFSDNQQLKQMNIQKSSPLMALSKSDFHSLKKVIKAVSTKWTAKFARSWVQEADSQSEQSSSAAQFNFNIEPYIVHDKIENRGMNNLTILSGAKTVLEFASKTGSTLVRTSVNCGINTKLLEKDDRSLGAFYDIGLSFISKRLDLSILSPICNLLKNTRFPSLKSNVLSVDNNASDEVLFDKSNMLAVSRTEHNFKWVRGPGSQDLYHFVDLTQDRVVRRPALLFRNEAIKTGAYTNNSKPPQSRSDTALTQSSLQNLVSKLYSYKTDLIFSKSSWSIQPGLYLDAAISYHPNPYNKQSDAKASNADKDINSDKLCNGAEKIAPGSLVFSSGAGLTLRSSGLRLEVAWPLQTRLLNLDPSLRKSKEFKLNQRRFDERNKASRMPTVYFGFDADF